MGWLMLQMLLLALFCLVLVVLLYMWLAPTFGGKPNGVSWQRIQQSPNFNGKKFENLMTAPVTKKVEVKKSPSMSKMLSNFMFPPQGKNPQVPLLSQPLNLQQQPLKSGQFVWLGHSTVLFNLQGKNFITDPVFHRASPAPIGGKPFTMQHAPKAADLPFIDAVLISHDHYDHLDHHAIKKIKQKVGHFYVPLGVKAHLLRWGVPNSKISEYDWYDEVWLTDILLAFTPTYHFSGRHVHNHYTTLWGSWVVKSPQLSVYFSGDGGYTKEFATIGNRYGPFDIAFMEDGAYSEYWAKVHMLPEESAQAAVDLQTKVLLPIHWGKFDLSFHEWREPVNRIKQAVQTNNAKLADKQKIKLATPKIGEVFDLTHLPNEAWWQQGE